MNETIKHLSRRFYQLSLFFCEHIGMR
uniref:Putative casein kinase II subunit beta-4 n=1 Tax=Rhizophora mucronata TaxID=61149 RepID=A0A2P2MJ66_RHIMU